MRDSGFIMAERMTDPKCVGLICVRKSDGALNLAPVTHWCLLSERPPMLVFDIRADSCSASSIIAREKFVLAIPDANLRTRIIEWGNCSGKYVDKLKKYPVETTMLDGDELYTVPTNCAAAYVCRVKQYLQNDNDYIFVCNVYRAFMDNQLKPMFSWYQAAHLGAVPQNKAIRDTYKIPYSLKF